MQALPPGSRVLVTWNDGRAYAATVCALAQGLVQVRWDGGTAAAWVPLASVRPLVGDAPAPPPAPPAPAAWNAYPAYSNARGATPAAGLGPASSPAGAAGTPAAYVPQAPVPSGRQAGRGSAPSGTVPYTGSTGAGVPPLANVAQPASHLAPTGPLFAPATIRDAPSGTQWLHPPASAAGSGGPGPAERGGGEFDETPSYAAISFATAATEVGGPPVAPPAGGAAGPQSVASGGPSHRPAGPARGRGGTLGMPNALGAALPAPPRPMGGTIGGLPRGLIYDPTGPGPGTGRAFFIFFGFVTSADGDVALRMTDLEHLGDDVTALRAAGFRVVVDLHGDAAGLNAALVGAHPDAPGAAAAGVFWGGHGDEGGALEDYEGFRIAPEQIAAEAARRGACALFVASAFGPGPHEERWRRALGPQATVVGWGAPATGERAVEFLTPDDASQKGFDDLLERHLGARRVADDGPLVEARDLARRHEDALATMLLSFDELVEAALKRLQCPLRRGKGGEAYFTARTPASKDRPDAPRAQVVRAAPVGASDAFVLVSSLVGPYSEALDLARGLRTVSPALHLRLAIARISPPDQDFVVVETLFRRRRLDPITLARNISAVGSYADRLEDLFFGSDRR